MSFDLFSDCFSPIRTGAPQLEYQRLCVAMSGKVHIKVCLLLIKNVVSFHLNKSKIFFYKNLKFSMCFITKPIYSSDVKQNKLEGRNRYSYLASDIW